MRAVYWQATIILLDTHFAHPLLAKLLPSTMSKSLNDVNEKVRISVADALLSVMNTNTISVQFDLRYLCHIWRDSVNFSQFYNVCTVDSIMARLEVDSATICRRLVKLLSPSFLPKDKPMQVSRDLGFLLNLCFVQRPPASV